MNVPHRLNRLTVSFAALAALAACGGGGGGGDAATPPPPPAVGGITLAGVVARGSAPSSASVAVTCATGTGTATTSSTGNYSVVITGGTLPCVLQATSSDSTPKLHSVAPAATTTSVTANVTPLTELVVARLSGADPAAYVAGITAATLNTTATATAVAAAQASVAATLSAGGVSTSAAGDFITSPLVAAVGGAPGNAYAQVLDALTARLTSAGTTLAALTTTIAAGSPAAPAPSPTASEATATLPADLLLKPKAANCTSLATGSFRLIFQAPSTGSTVTAVDTLDFDAPTLTARVAGQNAVTWTANGNCRYTTPDGAEIVVSPSGVVVARVNIGATDTRVAASARGTTRVVVGLPVQTIALADMAGTYNLAGWERNTTTYEASGNIITVASNGALTQVKCSGDPASTKESACSSKTTLLPVLSVNSAGGFNATSTNPADPYVNRIFAYRAGNGDLMGVFLGADGSMGYLSKQRTLSLPAVGTVSASWNVEANINGLAASPVYGGRTNTVVSVNTTAGTLVRNASANDAGTVTFPQTLQYNVSRNGYIYRPAASVTASDGSAVTVREAYLLPLRGMGMQTYYLPATTPTATNAVFGVSVAK